MAQLNWIIVHFIVIVKKEINHLLQFSPWSLVDFTHTTEAWIDYYKEEESNKIPISAIQESFRE